MFQKNIPIFRNGAAWPGVLIAVAVVYFALWQNEMIAYYFGYGLVGISVALSDRRSRKHVLSTIAVLILIVYPTMSMAFVYATFTIMKMLGIQLDGLVQKSSIIIAIPAAVLVSYLVPRRIGNEYAFGIRAMLFLVIIVSSFGEVYTVSVTVAWSMILSVICYVIPDCPLQSGPSSGNA